MNAFRQALCLWGVALIPALLSAVFFQLEWKRADNRVTLTEVRSWTDPVIWVDARPREKFEAGHWPEAVLMNPEEWDGLVPGFLDVWSPDARVVVYCDSRTCGVSEEVAEKIRSDFAHEAVYVLEGGWETLKEQRE